LGCLHKRHIRNLKHFRYILEYAVLRIFAALATGLSLKTIYCLGKGIGELLFRFGGNRKKVILTNLDIVFKKTISAREKETIAKNSLIQLVVSALQCLWLRADPEKRSYELFVGEPEGLKVVRDCLERKKGVFILSAHYGNWEAMGVRHGYFDIPPLHSIARRLDNPYIEKEALRFRSFSGNVIFHKDTSLMKLVRRVKSNGCVAVLLDQNTAKGGVFVDFLGKKAATARSVASLSLLTGAAIVPMFCISQGKGRYKIRYGPEIKFESLGDKEKDIIGLTQLCVDFIGNQIRQNPDPWMWIHRRWKTRPQEENKITIYP